jgi:hypothetical protein
MSATQQDSAAATVVMPNISRAQTIILKMQVPKGKDIYSSADHRLAYEHYFGVLPI